MKELIKNGLKKVGQGGLVIGGVGMMGIVSILQILFVWGAGLTTVYLGITLLLGGSTLWGLLVLFIGTPIAVGIAQFLFPFWVLLLIGGFIWMVIKWIF